MRRQYPDRQEGWLPDLFTSLPADERDRLLSQGSGRELAEGEDLRATESALIRVESGLVRIFVPGEERRLTVGLLGPRDTLISSLYHEWQPTVYGLQAEEPSTVRIVPREAVLAVADRHPEFSHALLRHLSWAQWYLFERLQSLVFSTLRERVCRALLNLAVVMGTPRDGGVHLGIRMTQEELAELVGTRRESLSATLQALREEGVLELRYARIDIKNLRALRRICGEEALPFVASRLNGATERRTGRRASGSSRAASARS